MTWITDGGAFVGRDPRDGFVYPVEALRQDMARHGVGRALVGSLRALFQDVDAGNREAASWARAHPGTVEPLGLAHPAYAGRDPAGFVSFLADDCRMRVLGLFSEPSYYAVDWSAPSVRALGEAAADRGMVLQAGINKAADLGHVVAAWGDLGVPVLVRWLGGHRYLALGSELAALAACPNLHVDVGTVTTVGALRALIDRVGVERLFWASNAPIHEHAPVRSALDMAGGDDAAQIVEQIGNGTIDRLLPPPSSWARPRGAAPLPQWARLAARPKVDMHWHPDHWNLGDARPAEEQRRIFDGLAYERVILSSVEALNHDMVAGNAATAAWADEDPRCRGLIVVDPTDVDTSLRQVKEYQDHPFFVGVKTIQDLSGHALSDDVYAPILEAAARAALPVVAHRPGVDAAAARYPEARFVITHATWGRTHGLADLRNVFFDFSTGHALRSETQLRRFIGVVGADRVLFGSDGSLMHPFWSLAKLADVGLEPAAEDKILRRNAYAVFPRLRGT